VLTTASGDDLTETDDPFEVAMRQIAGVFAQLGKARLVYRVARRRQAGMAIVSLHNQRVVELQARASCSVK
jgi:hypothetical protein